MEDWGIIYIIKNSVNNKVYVGQTIQTLEQRKKGHMYSLKRGSEAKLYKAMEQLGIDKFSFEVIERCPYEELDEREIYWIQQYDSYENGYNSTAGGSLLSVYAKYGEEMSDLYQVGYGAEHIASIYGCNPETVRNILKRRNIDVRSNYKPVYIIDLDMEFDSLVDTAKFLIEASISKSSKVRNVASTVGLACSEMVTVYGLRVAFVDDILSGTYKLQDGFVRSKQRCLKERQFKCTQCGKTIAGRSKDMLCVSCAQVKAKGKKPKPSKVELENLCRSLSLRDIGDLYDRTPSTVAYWKKQYNID